MKPNAARRAKARETAQRASLIFDRLVYQARRRGLTWPHYDGSEFFARKEAEERAAREERIAERRAEAKARYDRYVRQTAARWRGERNWAA